MFGRAYAYLSLYTMITTRAKLKVRDQKRSNCQDAAVNLQDSTFPACDCHVRRVQWPRARLSP